MVLHVLAVVLLCSTCFSEAATVGVIKNDDAIEDDEVIWKAIYNVTSANATGRTDDTELDVFETIMKANAEARGSGLARTDTDVFLFEGDIQVEKSELTGSGYPKGNRQKRAVIKNNGRNLWPRIIYYTFDGGLGSRGRSAVTSAINEWKTTLPCIQWVYVANTRGRSSYMHFFVGGGCYSQVGRVNGGQKVSIGRGCETHGVAVHEIGHAMGLWHEQSRPDRDSYVRILWQNIIPATKFNFQKQPTSRVYSFGVEYDYNSVMHYGAYAFARSSGLRTIESKRGSRYRRLGQRNGLSTLDKKQVQLLYKCGTAAKTTPRATKAPTTRPAVCKDSTSHQRWCIESKRLSLCENGLFKSYMTRYCCSTCKPAPPPTTPTRPKPTASGCRDKDVRNSCKSWKNRGFCKSDSLYHRYMMSNCCETCKCTDKSDVSDCIKWKARGYCKNNSTYVVYMKANCKYTCDAC